MYHEIDCTQGEEVNPIAHGAEKIRTFIKNFFAQNLPEELFPRNYQYMCGDYNLVFKIVRGYGNQAHGFFKSAWMVVLTPQGEFKSGEVEQYVSSDHSSWEFGRAKLKEAEDLEVIKYGPGLILELFSQMEKELPEQEDENKIAKILDLLSQRADVFVQIKYISQGAIKEMWGGEPEEEEIVETKDYGRLAKEGIDEIIRGFPSYHPPPELCQRAMAFGVWRDRERLVAEIKDLASKMRVRPVEDWFRNLIAKMVGEGVFPETTRVDEMGTAWFNPGGGVGKGNPLYSDYHSNGTWFWGVSTDGQVREFGGRKIAPRRCPEHLLEKAPEILYWFLRHTIRRYFPELKP